MGKLFGTVVVIKWFTLDLPETGDSSNPGDDLLGESVRRPEVGEDCNGRPVPRHPLLHLHVQGSGTCSGTFGTTFLTWLCLIF